MIAKKFFGTFSQKEVVFEAKRRCSFSNKETGIVASEKRSSGANNKEKKEKWHEKSDKKHENGHAATADTISEKASQTDPKPDI